MTYPFEQMLALAQANGRLFVRLTEISRAGWERELQIGRGFMVPIGDQSRDTPSGQAPDASREAVAGLVQDLAEVRTVALAGMKDAALEWQKACAEVLASCTTLLTSSCREQPAAGGGDDSPA